MHTLSRQRLDTCHPDLIRLFVAVDESLPVVIIQGQRTQDEEAQAIAAGLSHTNHSKHLMSPAMAVDASPEPYKPNDQDGCIRLNGVVQAAARLLGMKIRWGGAWDGTPNRPGMLMDFDHFELVQETQDVA